MKQLPKTNNAAVIRTAFEDESTWKKVCDLIRAPVEDYGSTFYAYVDFVEDMEFRDMNEEELLARVPENYNCFFFFVVDRVTLTHPELPILVVDLHSDRTPSFRAI